MAKVMLDAYKLRQLPKLFLDEIDRDYIPGIAIERYYNLTIPSAVVGYVEPVEESIPDMPNKEGAIDKGNRFVLLKPGSITLVWPGLFEDIWCWNNDEDPERSIDYFWGHKFRSDADIERIIATAADNNRFTIMGYYATACDLLAEWIEKHADDDQVDQGGDRDAVGSAALGAVVAGGLAGVLQAAVGARATDRVTAVMRQRIANDRTLYGWTQKDWADDLGASTKTISKCDAWREILDWRASNEVDRVSKETGK